MIAPGPAHSCWARAAFDRGALATAADTLRRAVDAVGTDPGAGLEAGSLLVEALALAGRVDEAVAVGAMVLATLSAEACHDVVRAEVHLTLAHAAVAASRWPLASSHLNDSERLTGPSPRSLVLRAEVAINTDDPGGALGLAQAALAAPDCPDPVRCHALELVGRSHRLRDLDDAREAFEEALRAAPTPGFRSGGFGPSTSSAPSRCSTTPGRRGWRKRAVPPTSSGL